MPVGQRWSPSASGVSSLSVCSGCWSEGFPFPISLYDRAGRASRKLYFSLLKNIQPFR